MTDVVITIDSNVRDRLYQYKGYAQGQITLSQAIAQIIERYLLVKYGPHWADTQSGVWD